MNQRISDPPSQRRRRASIHAQWTLSYIEIEAGEKTESSYLSGSKKL